jgi:hypothetical protein
VLGGQRERQEGVVPRLEAESPVVADAFELREEGACGARVFERCRRVDPQVVLLDCDRRIQLLDARPSRTASPLE